MKRNIGAIGIAAVCLLVFAAVFIYQTYSKYSTLVVNLRCSGNVSGKLTVELSSGENKATFDAAAACQAGKITVNGYNREDTARFTFEKASGERGDLLSKYGVNIQSDPKGFNMILKIMETYPFIGNEGI